ncbi:MAG TPA: ABC transporter permease [Thermomicrobiales bacterium]|nr:ABC transporter permease [Thermomicrobiales bacterium]
MTSQNPALPVVDERPNAFVRLSNSFTLVILALIVAVFFALRGLTFLSVPNLNNVLVDTSQLLLLTIGVTFVIITAGIDLSISSILILSAVVSAKAMIHFSGTLAETQAYQFPTQHVGIPIGLVLGVLTGVACGAINGLLVTRLQLPSFIVTLGTLGIFLGIAQLMTGGTTVAGVPPAIQNEIGLRNLLGGTRLEPHFRLIPPMVIAFAIAVVAAVALNKTRFGRYTYAIGSNAAAARRAGIDVDRHLLKVYLVSGLLSGVAGTFDLMRFGTASVGTHQSDNLAAISAAVIGGTSLFGGLGTIGGSVIGAFIPVVLRNGLVISAVPSFWQNVAVGVVLIVAVWLDQRRRRAEERM